MSVVDVDMRGSAKRPILDVDSDSCPPWMPAFCCEAGYLDLTSPNTAPAPVIEYVPDDTFAAPTPMVQHVALTPAVTCAAPAQ